jgi:hypothetical protein
MMQAILRGSSRLGLRAFRGATCQLSKGGPLQTPGGVIRAKMQQAGLRSGARAPVGRTALDPNA